MATSTGRAPKLARHKRTCGNRERLEYRELRISCAALSRSALSIEPSLRRSVFRCGGHLRGPVRSGSSPEAESTTAPDACQKSVRYFHTDPAIRFDLHR